MVTTPPPLGQSAAAHGAAAVSLPPLGAMAQQWAALHQAASVVAALADLPAETLPAERHDFPATIHAAGGWRLTLAEQGLTDLLAIMEPGLAALLAIRARGADPSAAARALWDEFHAARTALLVLVPPATLPEHPLV
jgi:hypothetical protein